MSNKQKRPKAIEHLCLAEDNKIFFENFLLSGNEYDLLGVELAPRVVDAAGLCICLSGESEAIIGTQSYLIKKGDMVVVFPNEILHIRGKSADFKGYTIACTQEFLMSVNIPSSTSLYLYIKNNPCISLKQEEQEGLLKMCDFLREHDARKEHPCRDEISRHLASAILYEVIGIYKRGEPLKVQPYSRKNKLYFEFIQLVAKYHHCQREVDFYADKLCITSRYLSSICKEVSGITSKGCIDHHIINHARLLLVTTDNTILQISEELNFPNSSFFSKYFKKHVGVTPKVYRDTHGD